MQPTAREVALKILGECRRNKLRLDAATSAMIDKSGLLERDTALAVRLIKGVIQNMLYCDYLVAHYSSIGLKKLHPLILDILRISIYQIVFLTKIPHRAAVSESVELAKKYTNPRAAVFVNAVLRKVASSMESGSLPEVMGDSECQRLSITYSHPEWLVLELSSFLGSEGTESFLKANNSPDTPVTAQINTLLADKETVRSMLAGDGVDASEHAWFDDCFELRSIGKIEQHEVFKKGYIYIQDAAARLAVVAAGPCPGAMVVDGCASPGGKSFAAAIAMKNSGRILARDISATKLNLIADGAARLGIGIIDTEEKDAMEQDFKLSGKADVVIADVPCSGFGAIRKKPDIRYKSQQDIADLPSIQKSILENLSALVKPGGTLLYSTCTVLKCENEEVVKAFLYEHPEFSPERFYLPGIGHVQDGMTTLWPHIHGTDGFFISKLRRLK